MSTTFISKERATSPLSTDSSIDTDHQRTSVPTQTQVSSTQSGATVPQPGDQSSFEQTMFPLQQQISNPEPIHASSVNSEHVSWYLIELLVDKKRSGKLLLL